MYSNATVNLTNRQMISNTVNDLMIPTPLTLRTKMTNVNTSLLINVQFLVCARKTLCCISSSHLRFNFMW